MRCNGVSFQQFFLWKVKINVRIKVLLWLVMKKSILTKDNQLKIGWKVGSACQFYGANETI